MSIHVALEHRTAYHYDRPVRLSPQVVRLRPAPHCRTPILSYSLTVEPVEHFVNWQQDPFGNYLARLVFPEPTSHFSVTVDLVADLTVINSFDFFLEEEAERYPFRYDDALSRDLAPYLVLAPAEPLLDGWMSALGAPPLGGMAVIDYLVGLNQRVQQDIAYTVRLEPGVQTPEETLSLRIGSCRDSAWLLVQILRRLGLAARFASGYLVQLVADEVALDGPSGPTADFTDLHAWAEVFLPGAGWVGMDPTSGLFAGEGHIPLACTPEPSSAAPITGLVEPASVTFDFANVVRRIREDPRVTKPYTDSQWRSIDALGVSVDDALVAGDVRLTMGGEPTYVSIDDMESPQWTVDADGLEKRTLALDLTHRLAKRFAPNGIIHFGQGKWYPGEALPRWQLAVFWRNDGVPLWNQPAMLAAAPGFTAPADREGASSAEALPDSPTAEDRVGALALGLAQRLGVPGSFVVPAYEDPLARVLAEARLPSGDPLPEGAALDALNPALQAAQTRAELVAALDATAGRVRGWAIPLHRVARPASEGGDRWATTRWQLRRGQMFLIPGDSPMGLRLPLDSLTWEPGAIEPERSPFEEPPFEEQPAPLEPTGVRPALVVPLRGSLTTALCVERRLGALHVFLPPLEDFAAAAELLAVIERVTTELGEPVVLEGYHLPSDPRLQHFVIAPDPGVIEVNIHPARSWPELVERSLILAEEGRLARLGTEKFDLDGSHTGTGGGSHITIGGAKPADSPLLRRPDLLRSLISYWQNHPSLSYVFSGKFVGPTSQAPRADEGRVENVYELEIAFAELDRLAEDPAPWVVDRLLRHLLTDVTGNTHRAEFCVDKLFSPDSERGRLGLLEMRGFEMPPHPQMALVQALLVRALVAQFWQAPFRAPLVRWGSELHDRFLLPHYAAADLAEVVADLRRGGFAFDFTWLAPFLEFRFPRLGTVTVDEVRLELRGAIEPWLVLGEEVTALGTSRYVDSSVERAQVLVTGIVPGRHVVTCNRVPLPLQPTEVAGTMVAGLRYRAWQPPSALHPTIAVHTPLIFDVIDRWNGRSLGGCTYHVTHPGGRSYDRFPVNANEAESRRTSRFVVGGHTPGTVDIDALDALAFRGPGTESPRTLDLRRYPPLTDRA